VPAMNAAGAAVTTGTQAPQRKGLRNARSQGNLNAAGGKPSWRAGGGGQGNNVPPVPSFPQALLSGGQTQASSSTLTTTPAALNSVESGMGKKKYPSNLNRTTGGPARPSAFSGPMGGSDLGIGLGLRTDSGGSLFVSDLGRVELRRRQQQKVDEEREQGGSSSTFETPVKGWRGADGAVGGGGLESLESLLSKAGYKETRVFTPEREMGTRGEGTKVEQVVVVVPLPVAAATTIASSEQPVEKDTRRMRLDVGLLNRRVEMRNQEQSHPQPPRTAPVAGPSVPVAGMGKTLRAAQSRSGLRSEIKVDGKRVSSAPAVVPTLSLRQQVSSPGPSSAVVEAAVVVEVSPVKPVSPVKHLEPTRSTPKEHAIQRGKAEALAGMDWADVEDSLEEVSPSPGLSGSSMMNSNKVQDTPSPAMRYKAVRLPMFDPAPVAPSGGPRGLMSPVEQATPVNVEQLFGKREDGTLFYPPIGLPADPSQKSMRGYPGQPGAANEPSVYPVAPVYPATTPSLQHQMSSGSLRHGQPFPNPHVHQYQYRPPVLPVAPLDPLLPIDGLALRKMRSEADIKIREVERRAEAEAMGRGWKQMEMVSPVPSVPAQYESGTASEISASGIDRKRKVLNRVDLAFKNVDIDELSDLDSEADEDDDMNVEVVVNHADGLGDLVAAVSRSATASPELVYNPVHRMQESYSDDRFDPAAYEHADDVDMAYADAMTCSDEEPYQQEFVDTPEEKHAETPIAASLESEAVMDVEVVTLPISAMDVEAFADSEMSVSTPKSCKIRSSTATPDQAQHQADVGSPASFASRSSRESVVRARGLRYAMSTPLLNTLIDRQENVVELTTANMKKFAAVGLGKPSAPPLSGGNWFGKFSQRMWSASTSVLTNTSKDDHHVPTKSAARPPMPRALTALATAQRLPASPKLVRVGAVICDSMESEDMPPMPLPEADGSVGLPFRALRTKLSLQMLGKAGQGMDLDDQPMAGSSKTPTLTPRPDWHDRDAKWANKPREASHDSFATPTKTKPVYQWTTNIDEVEAIESAEPDYTQSFFYKPGTPPRQTGQPASTSTSSREPKRQESIKSLRALLLKGVMAAKSAKDTVPPVPTIPSAYRSLPKKVPTGPPPPIFAISSPGAVEAGLPPRELVLEGEEWEGGSYESRKEQEKKLKKLKRKSSLRRNH
jgi:hypothetical protein